MREKSRQAGLMQNKKMVSNSQALQGRKYAMCSKNSKKCVSLVVTSKLNPQCKGKGEEIDTYAICISIKIAC